MMILGCNGSCRYINRLVFGVWISTESLRHKVDIGNAQTILASDCRTWFIKSWSHILATLAHRIVFDQESIFATSHKLNETSVNSFQSLFAQRLFPCKDTLSHIIYVKNFSDRLPLLIYLEHSTISIF